MKRFVTVKVGGMHNYFCAVKDEEYSMKFNSSTAFQLDKRECFVAGLSNFISPQKLFNDRLEVVR